MVVPASDVVLALGTMWGSLDGGVTYDVPFGALQDFSIDSKHTLKELRDPAFRTAAGVGSVASELTLKSKVAKIRGRALQALLGGTVAYDGTTYSTLSVKSTDIRPTAFAIQVHSRNDAASEILGTIYKAVSDQWSLSMKPEDFVMYDPNFKLYGDPANSDKILDIRLIGDHTTDTGTVPLPPTAPSATPGAAASGAIDLAWTAATGATGYRILRSTTSGSGYLFVGDCVGVKFRDYGTSATTYYYVIETQGAGGYSANSTQVSAAAP
jgi:hypothetical protein